MAAVAAFNGQSVPASPSPAPAAPAADAPKADAAPAAPADGEVAGKVETATRLMIRGMEMLIGREDTPAETSPAPEEPATQGKCDPACGVSKGMVGLAFFIL